MVRRPWLGLQGSGWKSGREVRHNGMVQRLRGFRPVWAALLTSALGLQTLASCGLLVLLLAAPAACCPPGDGLDAASVAASCCSGVDQDAQALTRSMAPKPHSLPAVVAAPGLREPVQLGVRGYRTPVAAIAHRTSDRSSPLLI